MPFNISPSSYVGPQLMMQGASALGKGIGDAFEKFDEQRKMEAYNDMIVQHALQAGQIDLDQYTKYKSMSHSAKTGFAGGIAANFVEDLKRQQFEALKEQREAQAQLRQQQAAAFNWTPDEATQQLARGTGNELIPTGPGKYQLAPYGGGGQDEVITDPLKINGNIVPGIGVNRKTGQYVYFGGLAGTGGDNVEIDPKTHAPFYRDTKGNKKFLTGQQIMAGQMMPDTTATPAPAAAGPMADILSKIQGALVGTGLAQRPAATPTPMPTPTDTGAEPVVPAVAAQTPAPSAQDQANAIKAQFKAGQISREDAIKALRALGFQ